MHSDVEPAIAASAAALSALRQLQQLLLSHPYAAAIHAPSTGHAASVAPMPPSVDLYSRLLDWKTRAEDLRQALTRGEGGAEMLSITPHIIALLRLVSPTPETSHAVLAEHCDGDWEALLVAELLFVYPPPLSREALWTVTEAAMGCLPRPFEGSGGSSSAGQGATSSDFTEEMRRVMSGHNAAIFLKVCPVCFHVNFSMPVKRRIYRNDNIITDS